MYDRREDMHGKQTQKIKAFAESRLYIQSICPASIDGFLRMPIINALPTVHALPTVVHTRLLAFRHPQPDVIFPISYGGDLLLIRCARGGLYCILPDAAT